MCPSLLIRKIGSCALFVVLISAACGWAREDAYTTLATELSTVSETIQNPKIAIIPFTYVDKRQSPAGIVISERLTTRMVRLKKCTIVERQMLEDVMKELHLEATGVIDAAHTKEIGKMLGVDAIISGSLMDISDNRVEVNARVVKTETAEVVTTSSVDLDRDWENTQGQAPQPEYQQAVYKKSEAAEVSETYSAPVRSSRPSPVDGFFDIFTGGGSGTIDLTLSNSASPLTTANIGFNLPAPTYSLKLTGVKTEAGSPPLIGLRVGGFGKYFGGDLEMSYYTQHIAIQSNSSYYFTKDDYLTVGVFNLLTGDIFLRYPGKYLQPYVGMGFGMTLNSVTSPYMYGYNGSSTYTRGMNDIGIGFTFRTPIGIRLMLGDFGCVFLETRPTKNTFTFDRGINNEKDTVSMDTTFTIIGYSARFGTPSR